MTYIFLAIYSTLLIIGLFGKTKSNTRPIYKAQNIKEIVTSIDYGRVYPFYISMNLKNAEKMVRQVHPDIQQFDRLVEMYKLTGRVPSLVLPISTEFIEYISVSISKSNIVDCVSINIKDFDKNLKPLVSEMISKFGNPTSWDNQFMMWRKGWEIISIYKGGSILVTNERLVI